MASFLSRAHKPPEQGSPDRSRTGDAVHAAMELSYERNSVRIQIRISYTGNRGIGLLRYQLNNLPVHDAAGVLVANHPNNAPAVLYTAANRTAGDPRGC